MLEAIDKAMCKIVCWIDLPLVTRLVMVSIENSICCKVPHLRIPIFDILLHPQERLLRSIFTVFHRAELSQIFVNRSRCMCASVTRSSFFTTSLFLHLHI